MISKKKTLIYLGLSGFPYGMAGIQRQILISKSVNSENWNVIIICPKPVYSKQKEISKVGHLGNIMYIYPSSPFKSENFILRNFKKCLIPINEFLTIKKIKKKYGITAGIVTNRNKFLASIKYFIISKLFNFNVFLNFVEIYKDREHTSLKNRLNDSLFNRFGLTFYSGHIPISQYIINYSKKWNKPHLYIPVIADLTEYDQIVKTDVKTEYFMYCGTAAYYHSIEFILKAFNLIKHLELKLLLVSNGTPDEIKKITDFISNLHLKDQVVLKHNLTKQELYTMYKNAKGLLLPLFDEIQDKARFPHKLAEYLASESIVLSNPVGEIVNFLKHNESVLFSNPSDHKSFAENMKWVVSNPSEAKAIAMNGKNVGDLNFNYLNYSAKLSKFLAEPKQNRDL